MISIEEYCDRQEPLDWSALFAACSSTCEFLLLLELPIVHPFVTATTRKLVPCTNHYDDYYLPHIPQQDPIVNQDHLESLLG